MRVIKRNGSEVDFDSNRIKIAVTKANNATNNGTLLSQEQIDDITDYVSYKCNKMTHAVNVEDIQDMVENQIMASGAREVAKNYVIYRYQRMLKRKGNPLHDKIMSLMDDSNEEAKQENSNKDPLVNSTARDYMAGYLSREITEEELLPPDIVEAHNQGIIHFHDSDYFVQHMYNCCLINLEDMFANGTVISNTMIETPKSFYTACNIATQIIAQVASNQYGGQTITLSHLAPYVEVSRRKIREQISTELSGLDISDEKKEEIVNIRLKDEIKRGVQTIQYQILTLLTTNGQTPFVSVAMYLNEVEDDYTRKDLAMIIEEMLIQRTQGVKNTSGAWTAPTFPKLLFVIDKYTCSEDREYWYLTKLAAKCTAKRMVPDYISEKIMLKYKIDKLGNGNCYPCMGCRSFLTPYVDENNKPKYYGRLTTWSSRL